MEINDYPNYLIYEDGRVWSKKNKKFLKPVMTNGYLRICLCKNSKKKSITIHRLIAIHYIPNPNNYLEVDHINRIKTDNRIENLRWATRQEQSFNKNAYSNTGEKHITKTYRKDVNKFYYNIYRKNCFNTTLSCKKWTLQDAINLRDSLLSIEDEIV